MFFQYDSWHVINRWRSGSRTGVLKRGKSIKRRCNSRSQHPQPHPPHQVQLSQAMFPWWQVAAVAWYRRLCQWLSKKSTEERRMCRLWLLIFLYYNRALSHFYTHGTLKSTYLWCNEKRNCDKRDKDCLLHGVLLKNTKKK